MKKILFIILLVVSVNGLAQTGFPLTQGMTNASGNTRLEVHGGVHAKKGLINGVYADTLTANGGYIDFYNGAQIYTRSDQNFWLRDSVLNMWIRMARFSEIGTGSGFDNTNLGSFYRLLVPSSQGIKGIAPGYGTLWDSTTNANSLTSKTDTSVIATVWDVDNVANNFSDGDTTIFETVIDSTSQPGQRVLFSGGNNKIRSDSYFLYDSTGNKLMINHFNISAGGPNTKLFVNGNTTLAGAVTINSGIINNTPTTSAGGFDVLTRNTSTGVVEKVASSSLGTTYTADLPIRITSTVISADTSVAYVPSLMTNAHGQQLIDSLAATITGGSQTLQQVFDTEVGGSVLTKMDTINVGSSSTEWLRILGSGSTLTLQVLNTGTGKGLVGSSVTSNAVEGNSSSGLGLRGTTTTGVAALEASTGLSSGSNIATVANFYSQAQSALGSNGIGGELLFGAESSTTVFPTAARFQWYYPDATHATRTTYLNWLAYNAGAEENVMQIQPDWVLVNNLADTLATRAYARSVGGGGGGTPGGADTEFQFNDGGVFNGSDNFKYISAVPSLVNLQISLQSVATSGGTTTLTISSPYETVLTGSSNHAVQLPDATTLQEGHRYRFTNTTTAQNITIRDDGSSNIVIFPTGYTYDVWLSDNATANGVWQFAGYNQDGGDGTGGSYTFAESVVNSNDSIFLNGEKIYPVRTNTVYSDSAGVQGHHNAEVINKTAINNKDFINYDSVNNQWINTRVHKEMVFEAGDLGYIDVGDSTLTDAAFIDRKLNVFRDEKLQRLGNTEYGYEVSGIGQITFHPPLFTNEVINIQIYDTMQWNSIIHTEEVSEVYVDFTTTGDLTEGPTGTWTSAAGTGKGFSTTSLAAGDGGYFVIRNTDAAADSNPIGLDDDASNTEDYFNWEYTVYRNAGTYKYHDNGGSVQNSGITASLNDWVRILKSGTTVKAQYSTNSGGSWSDIVTFSVSGNHTLYAKTALPVAGGKIIEAKVSNFQ